ncbi:MAG: cbb3-type cytochrome c oxidase subunit I [Deltaproteobacteria bacterium]|nr:cbb3-type cytochrome c oxidase subunit I [Deltaproteobacteria bacterium]
MSKVTIWFIRFAMLYFAAAMVIGIVMTISGPVYPLMQIHTHLNLLGWMTMMIYGVGYHILPRFSGAPLWSDRLSAAQLWLSNIGILGMVAGWVILAKGGSFVVLHVFSILEGVSVAMFVVNMFLTIKPAPAPVKK